LSQAPQFMPVLKRWTPLVTAVASAKMVKLFILRAMVLAWWGVTKHEKLVSTQTELTHLRKMAGKAVTSIWHMRKEMLVETALREIPDTSRQELEKLRRGELQLMIKKARDGIKIEARLPRGLTRMKHEELMREAAHRGINTADESKRYGLKIREQLIADIKEYETARAHEEAMKEFTTYMEQEPTEEPVEDEFQMVAGAPLSAPTALPKASAASSPPAPRGEEDVEVTDLLRRIQSNPTLRSILIQEPRLLRP